jgi:hypothetical protein
MTYRVLVHTGVAADSVPSPVTPDAVTCKAQQVVHPVPETHTCTGEWGAMHRTATAERLVLWSLPAYYRFCSQHGRLTEPRALLAAKVSGSGLPSVRPRLVCSAALSSSSAAV